jgi:hypothetical protein
MNPVILVFLFVAMNLLQTNAYAQTATPTAAEALDFMNEAEAQLSELSIKVSRAT